MGPVSQKSQKRPPGRISETSLGAVTRGHFYRGKRTLYHGKLHLVRVIDISQGKSPVVNFLSIREKDQTKRP